MIFVDTGAWFASMVPWDANHAVANHWLRQNQEPLLTTDFIADETITLLRARNEAVRAVQFGDLLFQGKLADLRFLSEAQVRDAWTILRTFADKDWSFTDCTSKLIIDQLAITKAFCFDQHFRQFGTVVVVP